MAEFDPANYAALKTELTTDPKGLGLAAMTDAAAAAKLNQVGASAETLPVTAPIDAYLVVNATIPADYAALTATERDRYAAITGAGKVDPSNANVVSAFAAMFGAGTTTRTNLQALANRSCSRAEKVWGAGVVVAPWDVARARAM